MREAHAEEKGIELAALGTLSENQPSVNKLQNLWKSTRIDASDARLKMKMLHLLKKHKAVLYYNYRHIWIGDVYLYAADRHSIKHA